MRTVQTRFRSVERLEHFLELQQLEDSTQLLVQIFAPLRDKNLENLLSFLIKRLPSAVCIGMKTPLVILEGKILSNQILITFSQFEASQIITAKQLSPVDAFEAGTALASQLSHESTKAILLFGSAMEQNHQHFLQGVRHRAGDAVLSGGIACDERFEESFVILGDEIIENGYVGVSLNGESLYAKNYFLHEWEPVSKDFKVTKQEGNRLIKLDEQSAAEVYNHYLDNELLQTIPALQLQFPLLYQHRGRYLSLQAMKVFEDGSLCLNAPAKLEQDLQIGFANLQRAIEGLTQMHEALKDQPCEQIFLYSSLARVRYMLPFHKQELARLNDCASICGAYTMGEYFSDESDTILLNHALSVLVLSEESVSASHFPKGHEVVPIRSGAYQTIQRLSHISQLSSKELELLNKKLQFKIEERLREIRKKESILIHHNRLAQLGEMLALIAHQWRQPLSAISATATGMQVKIELGEWDESYILESLGNIEKYVLHLSRTIDDFTDFFKPSKRAEQTTIRALIDRALFISGALLNKEGIEVIVKVEDDIPFRTYSNEIVQVLMNFIKNSTNILKKRHISDPQIFIKGYRKEGNVIIEFSDNGGGIEESIVDKIFDPYFSTKADSKSMGLGLYMSKFIVEESCGGELSVENGLRGATFKIVLPSL